MDRWLLLVVSWQQNNNTGIKLVLRVPGVVATAGANKTFTQLLLLLQLILILLLLLHLLLPAYMILFPRIFVTENLMQLYHKQTPNKLHRDGKTQWKLVDVKLSGY